MSKVGQKYRSFMKIELHDLKTLAEIAKNDRNNFFLKYPSWKRDFANRVLCIALCQGAGQHYVDGKTGINDFDNPKFGQSIDKPNFIGRRVDCLGREIEISKNETLIIALRRYLLECNTCASSILHLT